MTTTQIIWTVVIIVAALALLGLVMASMRKKNAADNRARAEQLRERADTRAAAGLPDADAEARKAAAEAEQARLAAERAEERAAAAQQGLVQQQAMHEDRIRAADRLDPDVDHRADDYTPDTSAAETRAQGDPDTVLDADDRPGRHAEGGTVAPGTTEATTGTTAGTGTDTDAPLLDEHGNPVEREGGGSHRA